MKLTELPKKVKEWQKRSEIEEINKLECKVKEEKESHERQEKLQELKSKLSKMQGIGKSSQKASPSAQKGSGLDNFAEAYRNLSFVDKPKKGSKKGYSGLQI